MMSKYLWIVLLVGLQNVMFAQAYQDIFENANYHLRGTNGLTHSNDHNLYAHLAWGESYVLMSYLAMYDATNDLAYLNKFIEHTSNVFKQRDDLHVPPRMDYDQQIRATWVCSKYTINRAYSYAHVGHSGMITYPMADFANRVFENSSLQTIIYSGPLNSYTGLSYDSIAHDIALKVEETIAAHDDQWRDDTYTGGGYYKSRDAYLIYYNNTELPFNLSNALGRTLTLMINVESYLGDTILEEVYYQKVEKLATKFNSKFAFSNGVAYWPYHSSDNNQLPNEDVSHSFINIEFVKLCAERNIVFTTFHLEAIAKRFEELVYVEPNHLIDFAGYNSPLQCVKWLPICDYSPVMYHCMLDFYSVKLYEDPEPPVVAQTSADTTFTASYMYGVALLSKYFSQFELLAYGRVNPDHTNWSDVASGDINGDGEQEILAVSNDKAKIYVYQYSLPDRNISTMFSQDLLSFGSNIISLAVGNFDDSDINEEVVVINDQDGGLYLYKLINNSFQLVGSYVFPNYPLLPNGKCAYDWVNVRKYNFDGDSHDEFVAARNYDKSLCMFSFNLNSQAIDIIEITDSINNGFSWLGLTVEDFDGDSEDEIIGLRSNNGGLIQFEFNGNNFIIKDFVQDLEVSNWEGITSGDFNGDGNIEIIAHAKNDGNFHIYNYVYNQSIETGTYYHGLYEEVFPIDAQNGVLESLSEAGIKSNLISFRNYDQDMFIYSVNLIGVGSALSIPEFESTDLPEDMKISNVELFPNPVNSHANIEFDLLYSGNLKLRLFDNNGRIIINETYREIKQGHNNLQFSLINIKPGIYYCQIIFKDCISSAKLVKL